MRGAPLSEDLARLARPATAAPYEAIRLALLDHLLAANAGGALTAAAWEGAFAAAATALRDAVLDHATMGMHAAGRRARYPASVLERQLPDAIAADTLLNRLLATGIPLEALASLPDSPAARRARGSALEGAWEAAVTLALEESRRWHAAAAWVTMWRRPLAPLVAGVGGLAVALTLTAAWLGGQLTPPEWFRPIHEAFWRLPWP